MVNHPDQKGPATQPKDEIQRQPESSELITERERYQVLYQLEDWLETPVMLLGVVWLILFVVELIWGLNSFLNSLVYFIWGIFILDFLLRFVLAPKKLVYLQKNWFTALSLFIPALRIGRVAYLARSFRVLKATRGLRLVSIVSSINRGMRTLRNTMQKRGFGYVVALTILVNLVGAAGMFTYEGSHVIGPTGLRDYGESLWWTAMLITTMGSDFWPSTAEGRFLALLLSLYGLAVFGYVTASLATYFIGHDTATTSVTDQQDVLEPSAPDEATAVNRQSGISPERLNLRNNIEVLQAELNDIRDETVLLRMEIAALRQTIDELKHLLQRVNQDKDRSYIGKRARRQDIDR